MAWWKCVCMGFSDPIMISVGKDHNDIKFDCILDDFFFLDGVNYLPKAEARLHSLHVMTKLVFPPANSYILHLNLLHLTGFTGKCRGTACKEITKLT